MSSGSGLLSTTRLPMQTPTLLQTIKKRKDRLVRDVVAGRHRSTSFIRLDELPADLHREDPRKTWSLAQLRGVGVQAECKAGEQSSG